MWKTNPQQYMATYFPDISPPMPQMPQGGAVAPEQDIAPDMNESLSANPASPELSQVPINSSGMPSI